VFELSLHTTQQWIVSVLDKISGLSPPFHYPNAPLGFEVEQVRMSGRWFVEHFKFPEA
jgi:hypothetical protein